MLRKPRVPLTFDSVSSTFSHVCHSASRSLSRPLSCSPLSAMAFVVFTVILHIVIFAQLKKIHLSSLTFGGIPRSPYDPLQGAAVHFPSERAASAIDADQTMISVKKGELPGFFDPIKERTLVVYVWSGNEAEYINNLIYFIRVAVHANDPADYFIILQQPDDRPLDMDAMPALPDNARYIPHANECSDWGSFGWLLSLPPSHANHVDKKKYKYFILLNSSIRGPFLPSYMEYIAPFSSPYFSWTSIFTSRLRSQSDLKLVGISIGDCAEKAHVESYLVATDSIGLSILEASNAMKCHTNFQSAVTHGEYGASKAILDAGFNIGVIVNYADRLNFRMPDRLEHCHRHEDQLMNGADGMALDPLDLVFSKYRPARGYDSVFAVERSKLYDRWTKEREARKQITDKDL